MQYILLVNNVPQLATDEEYWAWHENLPDTKKTTLGLKVDRAEIKDSVVSTVFLGQSKGLLDGKPILFETFVSGGTFHSWQKRYNSYQDAQEGHKEVCRRVSADLHSKA